MAANPHTEPDFAATSPKLKEGKKSHLGFLLLGLLRALGLAGGIAYELSQRKTEAQALAASTVASAGTGLPQVDVTRVRTAPSGATIEIPGQTMALLETPIYARADGYIKQRKV